MLPGHEQIAPSGNRILASDYGRSAFQRRGCGHLLPQNREFPRQIFLLSSNTQTLVIIFDGMADSESNRERAELSGMFRLLGDSRRLGVLLACRQKQRSVTEVAGAVGCSMALASHHLRLLRMGNLVEARRVGRQAFYRLADTHVSRMLDQMLHHARHCTAPMKTRPSKRPA